MIRLGAFLFRHRNVLFPVMVLAALLTGRPPAVESLRGLPALGLALGAVVALAGQALRVAVIGYVYIIRGGKHGRAYAEQLVREGLFAHARHPLYTGNILVAVGICLMWGTPFTLGVVVPTFLLSYLAMALNEEAFLVSKFGDEYRDYMRTVPRFVPDLRGVRTSVRGYAFDWRRVLRKDYGQLFLTLSAVVGLCAWRLRAALPWTPRAGWIAIAVLLIAYVTVRRLKLGGRLEGPTSTTAPVRSAG